MTAPSLNEIRGAASRDAADEKMEQIRDILVGEPLRRVESKVSYLENRLNDLEVSIARQLDALEVRLESLAGTAEGNRRATFEDLAASVAELSEQIRRISQR
jgi:uncharacterized coiled-coil protein SlyX